MESNYQMLLGIKDWKPQRHMIISEEEAQYIVSHFQIKERSDIELQNLRDFVVMYYSTQERTFDEMDKMSAITHMIDEEKMRRKMEV